MLFYRFMFLLECWKNVSKYACITLFNRFLTLTMRHSLLVYGLVEGCKNGLNMVVLHCSKMCFIFARTWYLGCVLGPQTSDPFGELTPEQKKREEYIYYICTHKSFEIAWTKQIILSGKFFLFFFDKERNVKNIIFSFRNVYLIISTVIIIYFVKILLHPQMSFLVEVDQSIISLVVLERII